MKRLIWAQDGMGDYFVKKLSVIVNFFSLINPISFIDPLHKKGKNLMLEVAEVLKLTLF